jgi:signal transduction histidine kinase
LNPNGVGLGLSICKKIVNHLEGEISVESTPQKGATFTFFVPYDVVQTDSKEDTDMDYSI